MTAALIGIGAGVAVLTGVGAGVGIGIATSKATEAIARQPEAKGDISKTLLLGCVLAEATAIYGFVIGVLVIFFLKDMTAAVGVGAGIAVLTGAGAGVGIGVATSKAVESIARQPEAKGDISKTLLLGSVLAEATAIYGFVIAVLCIFML